LVRVGVLALQGGVREHLQLLESIDALAVEVRAKTDLDSIDALVIPGGESTTISKLIDNFDLKSSIQSLIDSGVPLLGTCAGLILLSRQVDNQPGFFKALSCSVARNAYGSQLASGEALVSYADNDGERVAFIRAPRITVLSKTEPIAWFGEEVVAVQQGNIIGASYHPELTSSTALHRKLIALAKAD
jgi:5'-phosphate synthase pdxT subunit